MPTFALQVVDQFFVFCGLFCWSGIPEPYTGLEETWASAGGRRWE